VVSLVSIAIGFATGPSAAAATTHGVSMIGTTFSPKTLTVQAGDTVIWTNQSGLAHTVTADDGSFDSGSVQPGQTFSRTFSTAGTVAYHCSFHGAAGGIGMSGVIVVRSSAPPTTAPPVTTPATAPAPSPVPTTAAVAPVPVAASPATAPPTGSAPSATIADAAASTTASATATQPQLARTGSNATGLAVLGAVLLVVGAISLFTARRRSRYDASH
jgi:LPXTG-motif cell wall-anchored protein